MQTSSKSRRDFLKSAGIGAASLFIHGCARPDSASSQAGLAKRPNVVLVMTDDQGYGDLACLGNKMLKTPNIDEFYARSVRLTDFHVNPTCSPTRAGLLTGRYCNATGVWHTVMGRSMLRKDEVTLADCFKTSGYKTGIFGKWHLGDNYPFRPQDRGFDEVLIHGGGAIGNTPDFFGNGYFDDTYFRSDKTEKAAGYCTDVWFENAIRFISDCTKKDQPFFCYIPTNAAHGPYRVADAYRQLYDSNPNVPNANFYGMITNIDENFGKLTTFLKENDLEENTIVIFMTDNGSAVGESKGKGFNAGLRGHKGSEYEGGHRVPFFIRWPAGKLTGPRDIDSITAHIDILPTLVDFCSLKKPAGPEIHGKSLKPLFRSPADWKPRTLVPPGWIPRTLVTDSQRLEKLAKWRKCSVMTDKWRLVNGKELYDIKKDPSQKNNIAADHPDLVEQLRAEYEKYWQIISRRADEYCPTILGHDDQNPTCLTGHDWHNNGLGYPVFDQSQVRNAVRSNGFWAVDVDRPGRYEFQLRRWPVEADAPINAAIAGGKAINAVQAKIKIGDIEQTTPINPNDKAATFTLNLKPGPAKLQTWLIERDEKSRGAYYLYVKRL